MAIVLDEDREERKLSLNPRSGVYRKESSNVRIQDGTETDRNEINRSD
jgi:hypothetical protein